MKFVFAFTLLLSIVFICSVTARCPNHRCGSPDSYCPTNSSMYCSLCNDPKLCTFSNESTKVDVLGAFLFSDFFYKASNSPLSAINISIVAQTKLYDGKIYVSGFQLNVFINCGKKVFNSVFNVKSKWNEAEDKAVFTVSDPLGQVMSFHELNENDIEEPKFVLMQVSDCCDITAVITKKRYLIIKIDCFKINIGFRPKETGLVPCLYVEMEDRLPYEFESWLSHPTQLCLSPDFNLRKQQRVTSIHNRKDSMNFQAWSSRLNTSFPIEPENFYDLNNLVKNCPVNRRHLINPVGNLFEDNGTVRCLSKAGYQDLVKAATIALKAICFQDFSQCSDLENFVNIVCFNVRMKNTLREIFDTYCGS